MCLLFKHSETIIERYEMRVCVSVCMYINRSKSKQQQADEQKEGKKISIQVKSRRAPLNKQQLRQTSFETVKIHSMLVCIIHSVYTRVHSLLDTDDGRARARFPVFHWKRTLEAVMPFICWSKANNCKLKICSEIKINYGKKNSK